MSARARTDTEVRSARMLIAAEAREKAMKRLREAWRSGLMVEEWPSMEVALMMEYQGERADLREVSEGMEERREESIMEAREWVGGKDGWQ